MNVYYIIKKIQQKLYCINFNINRKSIDDALNMNKYLKKMFYEKREILSTMERETVEDLTSYISAINSLLNEMLCEFAFLIEKLEYNK